MILDVKGLADKYVGKNSGKLETEFAVIESGCLKNADKYISENGMSGVCVAVYDENTYKAAADRRPHADFEIILNPLNLHANEIGVDQLCSRLPLKFDYMIAVGAGTVHDITRYCAYTHGVPFISCPTAASVDGFCSSVAAMTWHGCKKTLTARAPKFVIADTDIIKNADLRLAKSGIGDMLGKYTALADWKIGSLLKNEYYCKDIADMVYDAADSVLNSVSGIISGDAKAYEKLVYGLLLSGIAMQIMGNSRPASGAEHHISHLIEMSPPTLNVHSDALHGEKVGVATLCAVKEYHRLAAVEQPRFIDYTPYTPKQYCEIFGKDMGDEITKENANDAADGVTAVLLADKWKDICTVIDEIPSYDRLKELYLKYGILSTPEDIGVSSDIKEKLLAYSPCVRNRLTLMRLRRCIVNK